MKKLFISYSRQDKKTVHRLAHELEDLGFKVWMDVTGIKGGTQWSMEIVKAIIDCDFFLLFVSSASIRSDSVRREVDIAYKNNKNIIPLRLEEVHIPLEWDYQISGIQWIECSNKDWKSRLSAALGAKRETLDLDVERERRPIKSQIRAPEKRVQIIIDGELSDFNDTRKQALITVLAAVLRVEEDEIKLLRVRSGSVILEIEMSEIASNRLLDVARKNDFRLIQQGIKSILFDREGEKTVEIKLGVERNYHIDTTTLSNLYPIAASVILVTLTVAAIFYFGVGYPGIGLSMFLLTNIILPLLVGITVAVIQERLREEPQSTMIIVIRIICIAIVIALLVGMVVYLITPPFRLSGFNWCQNENQTVSIHGRLTDRYGEDVSGETLQIQIFPEGGDSPLENAVSATTSLGGQLSVVIPQTHSWSVAQNKYTINFVYWYPHPITGTEQHRKIDFKRGAPFSCTNIAPQSPG